MRYLILSICFLIFAFPGKSQIPEDSAKAVVGYDGEYFMPYSETFIEESLVISPELARMKPSQVNLIRRKLEQCASSFRNDSIIIKSRGLKISLKKKIGPMHRYSELIRWIPAELEVSFFSTLARNNAPFWNKQPDASVFIHFNNPEKLVGDPVINDIYLEPVVVSDFYNWPEFDRISSPNRVVAFKNNDLNYFEPVSREDFILTLIAFFQSSIDKSEKERASRTQPPVYPPSVNQRENELKKYSEDLEAIRKFDPQLAERLMQAYIEAGAVSSASESQKETDNIIILNSWREAVRKLKAEMNAMSPVELKSQAWWSNTEESNVSGLTPAGFVGSRPLIRLNKNLLDKTKPVSSIRLILVEWSMLPGTGFEESSGFNLAYHELSELGFDESLWIQVSRLLDP